MSYTLIVATDEKYGIAKNNSIPWHCPRDMKHFKNTTSGHVVIMGRKTQETLFKPLKDRFNIVISKSKLENNKDLSTICDGGFLYCDSVETTNLICKIISPNKECFVIGGSEIYNEYLNKALISEVIWTKIPGDYNCDKFFDINMVYDDFICTDQEIHSDMEIQWWTRG